MSADVGVFVMGAIAGIVIFGFGCFVGWAAHQSKD